MSLPKFGSEENVEAIREIWKDFGARVVAHDPDTYVEPWHHEGIQLPPDGPIVVGREAIYAGVKDEASRLEFSRCEIFPKEIQLTSETTAYTWGEYVLQFTQRDGGDETKLEGKFLTILIKKPDGDWKIYRDCYN
jgi:uncharacterized protein (TIGR02246 family)